MNFADISVLCIGDLMLDRFVYADMERISPEAPVPILRLKHTREMLGGVGNVANNIASLGGRAVLVGMIGRDGPAQCLRQIIDSLPGIVSACVETKERSTICKTRFIAANQQVVRTDDESLELLSATEMSDLRAIIDLWLPRVGAVILSDYGKGMLSPPLTADIIARAKELGKVVFVDPKSKDFADYRGATCLTPNLKELAVASGERVGDEAAIMAAARKVMARAEAESVLVTRSEKGMMLIEATGKVSSVPARAREVFDVSGAGDTVIATMALCHAAGRSLPQAMHIANAAASVVVSKLGTATANLTEVMHELDAQDHALGIAPSPGVQELSKVQELVAGWKQQGLSVGFANGCFDVLHPGHVSLLAFARRECDRLIVALNSDESTRRLKGPTRPVNALEARAVVMASIRYVDCVVKFEEDTPFELIRALMPDVLIKGSDYDVESVVGGRLVQDAGGRVILAPLISGQSTTGTIARMQQTGSKTE